MMRGGVETTSRWLLVALACGVSGLAGCKRDDMADGGHLKPLEESRFFADHSSARPLVAGTITRDGQLNADAAVPWEDTFKGIGPMTRQGAGGQGTPPPFPITAADLARGQERFNIYCTPCHGRLGDGNGMIVQRGFTRPPTYHSERLRNAPLSYFVQVMTDGIGAMYPYRDRVREEDRWRIAAYIRALQVSQHAAVGELPEQDRAATQATTQAATRPGEGQ